MHKTFLILILTVASAVAANAGAPNFTNTPLLKPDGSSEPEISIGSGGTMAMVSLQWLFDPTNFGTFLWTGPFGSTPSFQGIVDNKLQRPGKSVFGAGDADVDIGSTGRLHISTLVFLLNPTFIRAQLGVSAITCPGPAASTFSISQCTAKIIATTNSDRQWITSDGPHVWISYHDPFQAALIHVQRSDDDGFTWKRVGDPIVGQDRLTADATFNNIQGKIVADPHTHNVYDIYAAGETGVLKARTFTPNHIVVSRSSDMGETWTANVAFTAAPGTSLANIFPALAVDPTNGNLYAVWSDGHTVSFASSTDQGTHWTSAVAVNTAPVTTAVLPWVAAYNGTVEVVYYGTSRFGPRSDRRLARLFRAVRWRHQLHADSGEPQSQSPWRHLHRGHWLWAGDAQPAGSVPSCHRPAKQQGRDHLRRRHANYVHEPK